MYKTIDISYKCWWFFFCKRIESHLRGNKWIKTKFGDSVFPEAYGFPLKGQERGMAFVLPRSITTGQSVPFRVPVGLRIKFSLTQPPGREKIPSTSCIINVPTPPPAHLRLGHNRTVDWSLRDFFFLINLCWSTLRSCEAPLLFCFLFFFMFFFLT